MREQINVEMWPFESVLNEFHSYSGWQIIGLEKRILHLRTISWALLNLLL